MTIAQRFAEMGTELGVDMSGCNSGNISTVINAITQLKNGEVTDSDVISMAMMNMTNTMSSGEGNGEGEGDGQQQNQEPAEPNGEDNGEDNDQQQNQEPAEPVVEEPVVEPSGD